MVDEKYWDSRMRNWAVAYAGIPVPKCAVGNYLQPDFSRTPDEIDAQLIESAMIVLKNGSGRSRRLYRLGWEMYVPEDRSTVVLCDIFKCGERKIYDMRQQLFSALQGVLDGMEHRRKFGELTA